MKGPSRQAPPVPGSGVNRYSPVTNWNDDPFGSDLFEPSPQYGQKKKPPPRPPPPKVNTRHPDIPVKPSHFMRKPTVLTSLLSRKSKTTVTNQSSHISFTSHNNLLLDGNSELDTSKMFPRCEPKNIQTGALIDLSSPPSSPTFTTRSSSDGLSVDSFSSDATTSTNHHNAFNNGNASQAESGFEDDFDLFLNSRKPMNKEDTLDDFTSVDPFSPPPPSNKPPLLKKPTLSKDLYEVSSNLNVPAALSVGPTIIRAKPARPKPPDNSALLKNTFGNSSVTSMNVNTTTPIQKINNGFGDNYDSKPLSWYRESPERDDRESSPPMPSVPPPPPPAGADAEPAAWPADPDAEPAAWPTDPDAEPAAWPTDPDAEPAAWPADPDAEPAAWPTDPDAEPAAWPADPDAEPAAWPADPDAEPAAWPTDPDEPDFPDEPADDEPYAIALFDYFTDHADDLCFSTNSRIRLIRRVDEEWMYGRVKSGAEGLFPANYVEVKVALPREWSRGGDGGAGGCGGGGARAATALYDFEPEQPGDLRLRAGDAIAVLSKLNDEWYFGECNGAKGQFPLNYVQMS